MTRARGPVPHSGIDVPDPSREHWSVLQSALLCAAPSCAGDDRFTADDLTTADVAELGAVCAGCPLLRECRAFADSVPYWASWAGVWAGVRLGKNVRPDYKRRSREAVSA
jgi:hypothetical protein